MSESTCVELREAAAELALGVLPGPERARALVHLARCVECRVLVDELSQTADSLLLLAPEAEPPLGFETKAAAHVGLRRPRRWRRMVVAVAASAAMAGVAGGLVVHAVEAPHNRLEREYVASIRTLGGQSLRAARLQSLRGGSVGEVFAYNGARPWVFMAVDSPRAKGRYACLLEIAGSGTVNVGEFEVQDGHGSWGRTVPVDLRRLRSVQLVRPDGTTVARADFA